MTPAKAQILANHTLVTSLNRKKLLLYEKIAKFLNSFYVTAKIAAQNRRRSFADQASAINTFHRLRIKSRYWSLKPYEVFKISYTNTAYEKRNGVAKRHTTLDIN